MALIKCPDCGKEISDGAPDCPNCGKRLLKSRLVAAILCFCFGVFGVHKFYEGKIMWGLIYLITGGLFGVGVIYDFVMLVLKKSDYYDPNA